MSRALSRVLVVAVTSVVAASPIAASEATLKLEEVIVTAQKRAQSLQDVPIAITAVSQGDDVEPEYLRCAGPAEGRAQPDHHRGL
ncbi:MAG: hypothetical protein IPG06_14025 [Haliea sp.]|nr:hypothetical protein [Haliea sp.]